MPARISASPSLPVKQKTDHRIVVALAEDADRSEIYAIRHQVYATELGQHRANRDERLCDTLDAFNVYITASLNDRVAGFVSITPPGRAYSIDKYFERKDFPFPFDDGLYEVRLLTVAPGFRRRSIAALLMYAALRWIESRCGTRVVAIGRREILGLYQKAGLRVLGGSTRAGAVTYDLLSATVAELRQVADHEETALRWLEKRADWRLTAPFHGVESCSHGGAFFEAVGEGLDHLERSQAIINADVLDAWFPPSPRVITALQDHLPWIVRTSPPTHCAGMIRAIAQGRGIHPDCIVPASGSSELIFLAFRQWLNRNSRVLILDPTYGEYAHVAERIVQCVVDRLPLLRRNHYALQPEALSTRVAAIAYDLVVIVNPNSPTGQHIPRDTLKKTISTFPSGTRVWLDETYVDYAASDQSLEKFAAESRNVVVCKSMSKVYALSGLRAAYLCAPKSIAAQIRAITPPWAVSLPAQLAAIKALEDPQYYANRYRETHYLRETLSKQLRALGLEVLPGTANFLLCHLDERLVDAATVSQRCQKRGLYIRDAGEISQLLGRHAMRIAVKDGQTNRRMVEILKSAL
jgi:histidinol-phosphate/aromatic aminotransferase/cobyric acid decarboxylase-like protein/GNAT superfamily N-acetyltransferase